MIELKEWLKKNKINYKNITSQIYDIEGLGRCLFIVHKKGKIFDESLNILLSDDEERSMYEDGIEHLIFQFGNNVFYSDIDLSNNFKLKLLKYIGSGKSEITYPFIGIHGKYELMNGCFDYKDWCKKAKFLGFKTLGICEKNTLAGTLPFQLACQKENIKSILGETVTIKCGTRDQFDSKLYVINETGWKNLVNINSYINIREEGKFIMLEELLDFGEGLIMVIDPSSFMIDKALVNELYKAFDRIYYQIDSLVYSDEELDKRYLTNLKEFVNSKLKPLLINDAYYLDEDNASLKNTLNLLANNISPINEGQYMKGFDENEKILISLFKTEDEYFKFIATAIEGLLQIEEICNYHINTNDRHLPRYDRKKNEIKKYKSNDAMLVDLLEKGLQQKKIKFLNEKPENGQWEDQWEDSYRERLDYELSIIREGGFVDYFLILWDIIEFCKDNHILTGLGRGSAAGSLITYLLDITKVDPLEFDLLFERFLNPGRLKKGLPDIDTDIDSLRRDEVKEYIENRYGKDRVCSMGTYTTLQLKAALQDFSRQKRIPVDTVRYLSAVLDFESLRPSWEDLMKEAAQKPFVKDFVIANTDIVEHMQLCIGQPKAASVHACAMLILPEGQSIFNTIPIRTGEVNGQKMLVSEWEGEFLEKAGYLKEDILGIVQLTKFQMIKDLVKKDLNEDVDIYDIPYDQTEVYELFRNGMSGDVFHLGSKGLTQYAFEVQPYNIRDLIAMLALYRPGAMENNFHKEYVNRKFGMSEVEYDFGSEEITKETYGLYIYQEQIMQMCTHLGGFTLAEADDIRKAMGKKIQSLIEESKSKFIEGAVRNKCPKDEAIQIWEKLEKFAGYGFNKSHATCYAITGYICQYLKWKYPIQYWTTAFEYAPEKQLVNYISEINKAGVVKIQPVDINVSEVKFTSSNEKQEIYWSISKVKQCGLVATEAILNERKSAEFFSFEEFLVRTKECKVNKLVIENLIFAGAFDTLERIRKPIDRLRLYNYYRDWAGIKKFESVRDKAIKTAIDNGMITCNWWWTLFQKQVSGYAFFNYEDLIFEDEDAWKGFEYMTLDKVNLGNFDKYADWNESQAVFAGIIEEIDVRTDSKGEEFARILIENNYDKTWFYIKRGDNWKNYKDYIMGCGKGNIFIGCGSPVYNQWMGMNVIQSVEDFDCEILTLFENQDPSKILETETHKAIEIFNERGVLSEYEYE